MHPITDSPHGIVSDDDVSSQSKINHFSKDQEHIVLSSDLQPHKKPIIDLNQDEKEVPSLYEIKPDADKYLNKYERPRFRDYDDQRYEYDDDFQPSYAGRAEIKSVPPPNFAKHRPVDDYVEYSRNNLYDNYKYGGGSSGDIEYDAHPNYFNRRPFQSRQYKDKLNDNLQYSVVSNTKPQGFFTSGLKNYSACPLNNKHCARAIRAKNDYASYFHRPVKQAVKRGSTSEGPVLFPDNAEQKAASSRMVQSLLSRSKYGYYPIYANKSRSYTKV